MEKMLKFLGLYSEEELQDEDFNESFFESILSTIGLIAFLIMMYMMIVIFC